MFSVGALEQLFWARERRFLNGISAEKCLLYLVYPEFCMDSISIQLQSQALASQQYSFMATVFFSQHGYYIWSVLRLQSYSAFCGRIDRYPDVHVLQWNILQVSVVTV